MRGNAGLMVNRGKMFNDRKQWLSSFGMYEFYRKVERI